MTDDKKTVDWAGIERDYTTTTRSIREIARWFSLSEGAIRKKAKADGWVRKASTQQDAPAHPPVVDVPRSSDVPKVEEVIGRGRNLADRMLDELDALTLHRGEMDVIIQENEQDPARLQALKQAVSLPVRVKTLQTLALAIKTMGETAASGGGKKQQRQDRAETASSGGKYGVRSGPRLAVNNS